MSQPRTIEAWCGISPDGELYADTVREDEWWAWQAVVECQKTPADIGRLQDEGWQVKRVRIDLIEGEPQSHAGVGSLVGQTVKPPTTT